jgi:hypothetical protein
MLARDVTNESARRQRQAAEPPPAEVAPRPADSKGSAAFIAKRPLPVREAKPCETRREILSLPGISGHRTEARAISSGVLASFLEEIMKKVLTALVGTGIFLVSGIAAAQYNQGWSGSYQPTAPPVRSSGLDNLGEEAQITFGVDRVMGLAFDRAKVDQDVSGTTVTTTNKTTTIGLFGMTGAQSTGLVPRLALDYFVMESISVGGSLIYISQTGTQDTEGGGLNGSTDLPTITTFELAPRVGYCMAFDETFSFWPRAGITYFSQKAETTITDPATGTSSTSTDTNSGLDLTLEGMVGISPFSNFAMLVGPYLDLGLSGTSKNEPASGTATENDLKATSYGLAVSILGYY